MDSCAQFSKDCVVSGEIVLKQGPQSHFGPDLAAMVQTCRATKRLAMTTVNRGLSMAALAAAPAFPRLVAAQKRRAAMRPTGCSSARRRRCRRAASSSRASKARDSSSGVASRPPARTSRRPIRFCGSSVSSKQLRQMTGQVEQLEYRNRQLEAQIRAMGGTPGGQGPGAQGPGAQAPAAAAATDSDREWVASRCSSRANDADRIAGAARCAACGGSGRRSDVFDPLAESERARCSRALGGMRAGHPPGAGVAQQGEEELPDIGAPGGRARRCPARSVEHGGGQSNMASIRNPSGAQQPNYQQQAYPAAAVWQRNRAAAAAATAAPAAIAGSLPTLPPSQTPKDEFDLGYGYVLRKDYALAERDACDGFLTQISQRRPAPPMRNTGWAKVMFQRQRYRRCGAGVPRPCRPSSALNLRRRPTRCCGSASRSPLSSERETGLRDAFGESRRASIRRLPPP